MTVQAPWSPAPADIEAAREVLRGVSIYTPMEESRWLSKILGGPVFLKAENLQRTGSFKIRGAFVRMSRLSDAERAAGVVAASAGNHAQGVALAAQLLGINATVFMPEGAPIPKEQATRGYGAEIKFHGHTLDQAIEEAVKYADRTGAVLIHPFNHPDIVTGQATCGTEILEQCPDVRTILVPTGGGGLVAGIAAAVKAVRPDVEIIAVQAAGASAYERSLAKGHPVPLGQMSTMADGIAVGCPGDVPFKLVQRHVDQLVTVSEESLSRALLLLLERAKLLVEPAGAAAVAAMLENPAQFATPAVGLLSGGNVDPLLLMRVVRHGMAAGGRYLSLRGCVSDRPGGLAQLLDELGRLGANVLEVAHERISAHLPLDSVEISVQAETRGPDHGLEIVKELESKGFPVTVMDGPLQRLTDS